MQHAGHPHPERDPEDQEAMLRRVLLGAAKDAPSVAQLRAVTVVGVADLVRVLAECVLVEELTRRVRLLSATISLPS